MKCAKAQNYFSDYMENTLKPDVKAAFEQHLAECSRCREDYQRFHAAVQLVDGAREVELPPDFHEQVMARVTRQRTAVAHPVRWWRIDWQSVFSTRMPARAVAVGAAVVLVAALLIQLTPLSTITAGFLPWLPSSDNVPIGETVDAPRSPLPWGITDSGKGICDAAAPGLSLSVKRDEANQSARAYLLRVQSCSSAEVDFQVSLLTSDGPSGISQKIYSGSVEGKHDAVIPVVIATEKKDAAVARVSWHGVDREYNKYAFVPSHEARTDDPVRLSFTDATAYDALYTVCAKYGVVIIASGDVDAPIDDLDKEFSGAEDALKETVSGADFEVHKLTVGAYMIEPGT